MDTPVSSHSTHNFVFVCVYVGGCFFFFTQPAVERLVHPTVEQMETAMQCHACLPLFRSPPPLAPAIWGKFSLGAFQIWRGSNKLSPSAFLLGSLSGLSFSLLLS